MTARLTVHPTHPQARLLQQISAGLFKGHVVALPTDTAYALVCALDDKNAVARLRRLRDIDDKHHLSLLCPDLSALATLARVNNPQYRLLKAATPGAFTFILDASKEVPRRVSHPSRKTIGLRVPSHPVPQALLALHGQAVIASTLILPEQSEPLDDPDDVLQALKGQVDAVVDAGPCPAQASTVVDLTPMANEQAPVLLRRGAGDPALIGLGE